MASRDYSDSEEEERKFISRHPIARDEEEGVARPAAAAGPSTRDEVDLDEDILMASEAPPSRPVPSDKPASASSGSQIRIKIRHPKPAKSEPRSSLSPPPPITLKFGVPPRSAKVEKAAYSSSEDDDIEAVPADRSVNDSNKSRSKAGQSPKKRPVDPAVPYPALPPVAGSSGGHKKSYDWLLPSSAGASHHGPEGRDESARRLSKSLGWQPGDTPELDRDTFNQLGASEYYGLSPAGTRLVDSKAAAAEARRRSHKRRRDGDPPGPGKNWRKGLKKGMPIPWKEGMETPTGTTPDHSRPGSPDGTPEAEAPRPIAPKVEYSVDPDIPFVLADADVLGFPVFSKPIVGPKMTLTNFPKVTPYFTPNNGGDTGPFPRREKVRSWKNSERTIVGVGGGTLRFKSWTKGPPSELTMILQADKEAQDAKNKLPKDGAGAQPRARPVAAANRPNMPTTPSEEEARVKRESVPIERETQSPSGSPPKKSRPSIKGEGAPKKSRSKPKTPRPSMTHSHSTESLASMSSLASADADTGDVTPSAASKGPRKSKLAQEIRPEEAIEIEE